jgi:hypothetical protein
MEWTNDATHVKSMWFCGTAITTSENGCHPPSTALASQQEHEHEKFGPSFRATDDAARSAVQSCDCTLVSRFCALSAFRNFIMGKCWVIFVNPAAFLGAFVSFVVSDRPSVCPHGTVRLPLEGFSWNLIFGYCSKICREKFKFYHKPTRITRTLHEDVCTFMIIYRWVVLIMRNISDTICRESRDTHFMFSIFFFRKACRLWDNVEKCSSAGQATDDNIIRLQTPTLNM